MPATSITGSPRHLRWRMLLRIAATCLGVIEDTWLWGTAHIFLVASGKKLGGSLTERRQVSEMIGRPLRRRPLRS